MSAWASAALFLCLLPAGRGEREAVSEPHVADLAELRQSQLAAAVSLHVPFLVKQTSYECWTNVIHSPSQSAVPPSPGSVHPLLSWHSRAFPSGALQSTIEASLVLMLCGHVPPALQILLGA